jgi:hypothetical protein
VEWAHFPPTSCSRFDAKMDNFYYHHQNLLYKLVKSYKVFESPQVEIDEMVIKLEVATSQD